jgi:RNA polymerase sigma factor (sigma-70 family)
MLRLGQTYREIDLVRDCLDGKRGAEEALYKRYSAKMLGICLRYLPDRAEAEDAMVSAMVRVFAQLATFRQEGSFEGWVRRIAVNEALGVLRRKKNLRFEEVEVANRQRSDHDAETKLEADELLQMVQHLPPGYRTVFNLYAIEGYSHKEIAELLGVTESTSKSQLNRARNLLKEMIAKHQGVPLLAL